MGIENSFDENSEAMFSPEDFYGKHEKIADVCIITFSHAVHEKVLKSYACIKVTNSATANGKIPVYLIENEGKNVLFYMSPIGATCAGTIMDEVRVLTGATKFIVFGSCGILDKEKCSGKIIVPTEAFRDEGFSYHFEKAADYIEIKNCIKLAEFFEKQGFDYVSGKTWTTDAIYRETINNKNLRKGEGCICVEMECAGIQALCNFRNIDLFPFFFGGDLLNDTTWDRNTLGTEAEKKEQISCFSLALRFAKELV
ncbi:MAG: nucleoside phosphorylase [Treponema sp.]|nr:nucleoside phosphorylase [Treponema sp.]